MSKLRHHDKLLPLLPEDCWVEWNGKDRTLEVHGHVGIVIYGPAQDGAASVEDMVELFIDVLEGISDVALSRIDILRKKLEEEALL